MFKSVHSKIEMPWYEWIMGMMEHHNLTRQQAQERFDDKVRKGSLIRVYKAGE